MTDLIINSSSKTIIDSLVSRFPQSILLTGDVGVGLATIAIDISEKVGIKPQIILPEKDETIDLEKGIISVEMMREIYENSRSKIKGGRIIIIDYAEKMTPQAQNAFLKLLEEPNEGTHFILLSHSYPMLLPTILSRLEKVIINNISTKQTLDLLDSLEISSDAKRTQLIFMAEGLPAEIFRLVNNDEYFAIRSSNIKDAKIFIQDSFYNKMSIIQNYKDDREATLRLLNDAAKIIKISLCAHPRVELVKILDRILIANDKIIANGNIRLVLTEIFV